MNDVEIIRTYLDQHYRIVTWPAIGDLKGPRQENWQKKTYTLDDYRDGYRVGILTGVEIEPGKFLVDVDIDWADGSIIAQRILPPTGFVYGRPSKKVSHCFYTIPELLASFKYEDIDKTCLIELRGAKISGDLGLQSMAPPSMWSKDGKREPLTFVKHDTPAHVDNASTLRQRVCLAAIAMILARHLGKNGFGHEPRLAFSGFLLRAGIPVEDIITIGEAISPFCQNTELIDVRRSVESTALRMNDSKHKVKGGPAFAKLLGDRGRAVIARINEWLGRDSDFARADGQIIKDHQANIKRAITLLGKELTYNAFSDKVLVDNVPLEDREMEDLWLRIDEEHRFRPTYAFFEKVVRRLAYDNQFHPVKTYLDSLVWDGTPRIDAWLIQYAGADDSAYTRAISGIVLIAGVKRIRDPGCKYDEIVVLEGLQGLNKSSALRALCPKAEWFSDDLPLNVTSQRMIEATLGKWVIEAADLAGKRKAEVDHLKSMISRQVDGPARMAYAHLPVERPRQFIIIGTTNSAAYLTDPTGSRRFWPVAIKKFDVHQIVSNRDQLWAEAAQRETGGESIRLHESLWPHATEHQEARREIDPWEAAIRNALLAIEPNTDGHRRITTSALWDAIGIEMVRRDRYGALRISEIMQRLGFVRTRVRPPGGEVEVGYVSSDTTKLELPATEELLTGREPGSDDVPF